MKRIDIGGAIRPRLWEQVTPFPLVEVTEYLLPVRNGVQVYAQGVRMPMLVSTYLETAAHLYRGRETISDLPLDRLFTSAVVLRVPLGPGAPITAAALQAALAASGATLERGDSLIVATGWDTYWDAPNFASDSPYFTTEAIEWVLAHNPGLLGSDAARWDNGTQGFFPAFFQTETLLLAPLVNLGAITQSRVQLITLPLKLAGVCAAQCRVIAVEAE